VLEHILPPAVVAVETFQDEPHAVLFPEEEAVIARAVGKRRREFTSGRACARAALARLGVPPAPLLPGPRGAPRWPDGITGSITHCAGYRAAGVARTRDVAALGLDAEPDEALPDGVLPVIAREGERSRIARLEVTAPGVSWGRLLFSAKESVYKAWFPLTGRWLGFDQADIAIDAGRTGTPSIATPSIATADAGTPDAGTPSTGAPGTGLRSGTFTARLLVPGPLVAGSRLTTLHGRWLADRGLVATAVAVPA
jgi:4'-phosphopantetheinyl transferase EntD